MPAVVRSVRVLINGVDVTGHVRELEVRAGVDCVVVAHLELLACPTITQENGTTDFSFSLPGPIAGGLIPSPDGALRGIVIRAEEP